MTGVRRPALIASDVDGTLIDDGMRVGARARAVLAGAVEDGASFVLCTGRPPRWTRQIVDQLAHPPLAVCANGAVVFDSATDEVVAAHTLDTDALEWLAERIEAILPGAALAAERIDPGARSATAMEFVTSPRYEHAWENPRNIEVDDFEVVAVPAIKLLVRVPGKPSAMLRDALVPAIGDRAAVTYSTEDGLIEVAAPGVTKALGLADVASGSASGRSSVERSDVIAFGDMPNDVPMVSWAGHGVAVRNAHPELLTVADEVTASNNDEGVALVLERWWG